MPYDQATAVNSSASTSGKPLGTVMPPCMSSKPSNRQEDVEERRGQRGGSMMPEAGLTSLGLLLLLLLLLLAPVGDVEA